VNEWTVEAVLRWAAGDFHTRQIESSRLDAEVLLAFALGTTRIGLVMEGKKPLAPEELERFRELVKRRRTHEPVAYLRGEREFYGRTFKVDRRVLVPRPDTETLVEVALLRSRRVSMSMRALDLCTGSGCVAVSLARERPTSSVVATDVSDDALAVARDNALRLGAYNVTFVQGDLFTACAGLRASKASSAFDVVVANPPYIPEGEIPGLMKDVRDFEPKLALDGGGDGLDLVRRIVAEAPHYLAPEGILALEVGAGQAPAVAALFEAAGFSAVERAKDYGRIERVVSGVWNSGTR
jgi:release factor glutamine methyltransferase